MKGNTVCISKRGGGSHTQQTHREQRRNWRRRWNKTKETWTRERSKKKTWSKCKSVVYSREVVGAGAFRAFLHLIIIPARIAARLFSLSLSLLSLSFFAAVSVSSELSSNTTSPSSAVFNSQKSRRKKKTKKKNI